MIKLKKLFAALLVSALAATVFAGIASADYSYDAATGTRTWTFNTPATPQNLNQNPGDTDPTAHSTMYWLYSNDLTYYGADDTAKENAAKAQTYEDLFISSRCGNAQKHTLGASKLYMRYAKQVYACLKAPFDGTVNVEGSAGSAGIITIDDTVQTEVKVKAGATVNISASDSYCSITKITFTPSTSTETFDVESITIGDDTKNAGVIFKADGYKDWNCSILDKVQNFRGNVDFKVQMNNVPTNVEVSAQSYAN